LDTTSDKSKRLQAATQL